MSTEGGLPVFKDIVPPADAPAAIRPPEGSNAIPKERVDAVIARLKARTEEIIPHIDTQPTPEQVTSGVQADLAAQIVEARKSVKEIEDTKTSVFGGLAGKMTQKAKSEWLDDAYAELDAAKARESQADEIAKPEADAARTYSRGYLEKQAGITRGPDGTILSTNRNQELIGANTRVDPMLTATPDLKTALSSQKTTQKNIEEAKQTDPEYQRKQREWEQAEPTREQEAQYNLWELPHDEESMLPTPVYEAISANIAEHHRDQPDYLEGGIRFHQTTYEIAQEYANRYGVTINPDHYRQIVETALPDWHREYNKYPAQDALLKKYCGDAYTNILRGAAYANARTDLEEMFQRLQIPEGAERVPYVLAYTAAKFTSDPFMVDEEYLLRDLLAETVPTDYLDAEGTAHHDKPLGLGYLVGPEATGELNVNLSNRPVLPSERGGGYNSGQLNYSEKKARAAAALKVASQMTRDFNDRAVRGHRNYLPRAFEPIRGFNGSVYSAFQDFRLVRDYIEIPYYTEETGMSPVEMVAPAVESSTATPESVPIPAAPVAEAPAPVEPPIDTAQNLAQYRENFLAMPSNIRGHLRTMIEGMPHSDLSRIDWANPPDELILYTALARSYWGENHRPGNTHKTVYNIAGRAFYDLRADFSDPNSPRRWEGVDSAERRGVGGDIVSNINTRFSEANEGEFNYDDEARQQAEREARDTAVIVALSCGNITAARQIIESSPLIETTGVNLTFNRLRAANTFDIVRQVYPIDQRQKLDELVAEFSQPVGAEPTPEVSA